MARDYKRISSNDSGIPPRAKALMVLTAVVTLVAIWLVPDGERETPPPLPEMSAPPQAEQPLPLPLPPVREDGGTPNQHDGDKARAIVAELRAGNSEPDAGEAFARAEQLQSEGQLADAYLLYRLAARQGHAQAALVLGTQADPAFYTSQASVLPEPDLQQAYKWYRTAAAAGNEEAVQRLQQLREHVEQSAAGGNAAARRLLLQWQ